MTFTFKLARRLAVSRHNPVLFALGLVTACQGDSMAPEGTSPPARGAVESLTVYPQVVTVETNQPVKFAVRERTRRGEVVVAPIAWAATGGNMRANGTFSADRPGTYKVVGRGRRWKHSDTSVVVVIPSPPNIVKLALSPDSVTLAGGAEATFTATGYASDGSSTAIGVTWTAEGGEIDAGGTYTAGETGGGFKVVAKNLAGTLADTAVVLIQNPPTAPSPAPPPPTLARVVLTPATLSLQTGATAQFLAYGRNSAGDSVGVPVSFSATGGSITPAGVYTAGPAAGSYRVIAAGGNLADTALVTLAAPPPAPAPPPPPPPGGSGRKYGLHMDITYYGAGSFRTTAVQKAAAVNARISRNTLVWYAIEPTKGSRNWANHDGAINELVAAGIEPLLFIGSSPSWANGSSDPWVVPTSEAAFQTWLTEYRSFITAAVTRYKDRVKKWELWNEENEVYFWKPAPNIDQYARFYRMAYDAIKAVDPSAEVSMGGLAGLVNGCCISGKAFLQGLYDRGIRPDIVNIHPYALKEQAPDVHLNWESNFDDIAAIRALMVANGEASKPIWATEWGWSSTAVGEASQAAYVGKSLQMLDSLYPYVTVATYFLEFDQSGYSQGLFDSSFRMKPAGSAFRDFVAAH